MLIGQILRYGAVGLINTGLGFGVIVLLSTKFGFGEVAANALGFAIGFVVSYGLNRTFTFRSDAAVGRSLLRFVAVVGVSYAVNLATVLMCSRLIGLPSLLAQAMGVGVYSVLVFVGSRMFCFPPRQPDEIPETPAPEAM